MRSTDFAAIVTPTITSASPPRRSEPKPPTIKKLPPKAAGPTKPASFRW